MKNLKLAFVIFACLCSIWSCKPEEATKIEVGVAPTADFEIQATSNPNKFKLINKSQGTFLYQWDLGNGLKSDTSVVDAYYGQKGTYKVTLTAFNKGGFGTATKELTVAKDDPASCAGDIQLLTGCAARTWRLAPEADALFVGPSITERWWGIPSGDIPKRPCQFNDEFTFSVDGTYRYDSKDDFWADSDNSGKIYPPELNMTPGCNPTSNLPDKFKPWGSGTHRFAVAGKKMILTGKGAFIGLYKAANGTEPLAPVDAITYDIVELTPTKLVVAINYGPGFWRFTLIPK